MARKALSGAANRLTNQGMQCNEIVGVLTAMSPEAVDHYLYMDRETEIQRRDYDGVPGFSFITIFIRVYGQGNYGLVFIIIDQEPRRITWFLILMTGTQDCGKPCTDVVKPCPQKLHIKSLKKSITVLVQARITYSPCLPW